MAILNMIWLIGLSICAIMVSANNPCDPNPCGEFGECHPSRRIFEPYHCVCDSPAFTGRHCSPKVMLLDEDSVIKPGFSDAEGWIITSLQLDSEQPCFSADAEFRFQVSTRNRMATVEMKVGEKIVASNIYDQYLTVNEKPYTFRFLGDCSVNITVGTVEGTRPLQKIVSLFDGQAGRNVLKIRLGANRCDPMSGVACHHENEGSVCSLSDTNDAAVCDCAPGWAGERCEENFNDCDVDPCQNGGTCVDQVGGYGCECFWAFSGPNCENIGSITSQVAASSTLKDNEIIDDFQIEAIELPIPTSESNLGCAPNTYFPVTEIIDGKSGVSLKDHNQMQSFGRSEYDLQKIKDHTIHTFEFSGQCAMRLTVRVLADRSTTFLSLGRLFDGSNRLVIEAHHIADNTDESDDSSDISGDDEDDVTCAEGLYPPECLRCAPGWKYIDGGAVSLHMPQTCERCPEDTYTHRYGSSVCDDCPEGWSTHGEIGASLCTKVSDSEPASVCDNDNLCQNEGGCVPNDASSSGYICSCPTGFEGVHCENIIPDVPSQDNPSAEGASQDDFLPYIQASKSVRAIIPLIIPINVAFPANPVVSGDVSDHPFWSTFLPELATSLGTTSDRIELKHSVLREHAASYETAPSRPMLKSITRGNLVEGQEEDQEEEHNENRNPKASRRLLGLFDPINWEDTDVERLLKVEVEFTVGDAKAEGDNYLSPDILYYSLVQQQADEDSAWRSSTWGRFMSYRPLEYCDDGSEHVLCSAYYERRANGLAFFWGLISVGVSLAVCMISVITLAFRVRTNQWPSWIRTYIIARFMTHFSKFSQYAATMMDDGRNRHGFVSPTYRSVAHSFSQPASQQPLNMNHNDTATTTTTRNSRKDEETNQTYQRVLDLEYGLHDDDDTALLSMSADEAQEDDGHNGAEDNHDDIFASEDDDALLLSGTVRSEEDTSSSSSSSSSSTKSSPLLLSPPADDTA